MRFEYDERTCTAIDRVNKIRLRMSSRFYDTDHLNFDYADEHVEFVFAAFEATERRLVHARGRSMEYPLPVAMYVVEQTVKRGARLLPIARAKALARYPEIRRAIECGMLALGTQGGKLLDMVPDYRVEYVCDFSNLPQLHG
jgi:hypothetical protein